MIKFKVVIPLILFFAVSFLLINNSNIFASGNEWYVAPNGSPTGNGSLEKPWDLQTALNHPSSVKPGDIIWVRGGTYYGTYLSQLKGSPTSPIIVRAYPGERATIDSRTDQKRLAVIESRGNDTWIWGLEIMSSYEKRGVFPCPAGGSCSWSNSSRVDGIATYGVRNKFINLVVHDTSQGFAMFQGIDQEVYGALIYYNGWIATDRGHGHAIYAQNPHPNQPGPSKKIIEETIAFKNFGIGQRVYGSGAAYGQNVEFRGNVSIDQGAPGFGYDALWMNYLVTAGTGARDIVFEQNHSYYSPVKYENGRVAFGYRWTPREYNISIKDNFFIGGINTVEIFRWNDIDFSNNTLYSRTGNTLYLCARADQPVAGSNRYNFANNKYYGAGTFRFTNSCAIDGDTPGVPSFNFTGFKNTTGLDSTSSFTAGRPTGIWTQVRPNKYEPGRSHVIVYNWDLAPNVSVDLSGTGLKSGQKFEVRDAQNFYGPALFAGSYDGKPVSLPTNLTSIAPIVKENNNVVPTLMHTAPEFVVYVVLPISEKSNLPPIPVVTQSDTAIDNTGPTVSIIFPSNNSTISSSIPFSASASDPSGVRSVQFTINGTNYGSEIKITPYTISVDTTKLANGIYDFGATATDNKGNKSTAVVRVTVSNTSSQNTTTNLPQNNTAPTSKWERYIEAESGVITSPMSSVSSNQASGGSYIVSNKANSGSAQYSVDIPEAGQYYVWGRILAPTFSNDSFGVSFGNNTSDIWDVAEKLWSSSWQWTRVTGRASNNGLPVDYNATPRVFNLTKGVNSLVIQGRDINTGLDRIFITNDPNSVPSGALITLPPAPESAPLAPAPQNPPPSTTQNIPTSSTANPSPTTVSQNAIRINAGGWSRQFVDSFGNTWAIDTNFNRGALAYGTNYGGIDFALYATGRQGLYTDFSYNVPVANGTYKVRLHFAELYQSAVANRVFNVTIEDNNVLSNFDILSEVSPRTPLVKEFDVQVKDKILDISFIGVKGRGTVSGIEIIPINLDVAEIPKENKGFVFNLASVISSFVKMLGF